MEFGLAYGKERVHAGGWKVTNAELHKFDEPTINQQSLERHGMLKGFYSAEAVLSE